jgi:hypothetical protein
MNISRENAKALLSLTRKKTFSAAFDTLGITQAALSIRIQRLEEELQHTPDHPGKKWRNSDLCRKEVTRFL